MTHPTKLTAEAVAVIQGRRNKAGSEVDKCKCNGCSTFVKHARADIDALLADREVLEAENKYLQAEVNEWRVNSETGQALKQAMDECASERERRTTAQDALRPLHQQVATLEAELQELRELVAFYQGEGDAQVPEEDEYRQLASISPAKRTKEQSERLRFLATKIVRLCDPKSLRAELQEARERLADTRVLLKTASKFNRQDELEAINEWRTQLVAAVRALPTNADGSLVKLGHVLNAIEEFEVRGA